jgi:predicted aldo/keto reductase-like oxidoreductase
VIIATKTGAADYGGAMDHLELSLQRLNTGYIDLWQFHNVATFESLDRVLGRGGAMEAAHEASADGRVRHIGITSHSMDVALKATAMGLFETIQFPFNVITCEPAESLVPLAREHDVGFIAMKPLAGGLFDNARIAFKYLLQFDDVVPDPGIETAAEIDEIVEIVGGPREISDAEIEEMDRLREELGTRFCRRCQYCQPCPEGISMPVIMNLVGFNKRLTREQMFSGWVAAAVEKARGCVGCGECEEKCPYGLEIRAIIAENVAFYDALERPYAPR